MSALTTHEATELAGRIVNTMRPTPPIADWVEELTGLHRDRAWRIYRSLRADTEDGLRIGTFVRLYRDDVAKERRARTENEPPAVCGQCDNTGFVTASQLQAHRPTFCHGDPTTGTCTCSAVIPCGCTIGQTRSDVYHRILEANAKETR